VLFKLFDESEFLLGFFASLLFLTLEQQQQQKQKQQIHSSYRLNWLLFFEYKKQWDE